MEPKEFRPQADDPLVVTLKDIGQIGDRLIADLLILVNLCRQLLRLIGHSPDG